MFVLSDMPADAHPVKALILDTETTGVDADDEIIELAMLPILFDGNTGALYAIGEFFCQKQQPSKPIPEKASAVNGIFDADVKGCHIDWLEVVEYLNETDLVVCHNTSFDKKKVERTCNLLELPLPPRTWACSLQQLSWAGLAPNAKQEVLCAFVTGFWYKAHRADCDVFALLALLVQSDRLAELYQAAILPSWELFVAFPYDPKKTTLLKEHKPEGKKYTFDGTRKAWWVDLPSQKAVDEELLWLSHNIYHRDARKAVEIREVTPETRFGL